MSNPSSTYIVISTQTTMNYLIRYNAAVDCFTLCVAVMPWRRKIGYSFHNHDNEEVLCQ
jgi:hypothetical protein